MKRNKRIEERLIDLSQEVKHPNVIPLMIEYVDVFTTCINTTQCDKQTASEYAITYLTNKYRYKQTPKVLDLDDVCLVNCNIQRYR